MFGEEPDRNPPNLEPQSERGVEIAVKQLDDVGVKIDHPIVDLADKKKASGDKDDQ
jgi:hypothetical protein